MFANLNELQSERLLAAMARLSKNYDFEELALALRAELSDTDAALRTLTDVQLFRSQGKAQTLAELLTSVQDAQHQIEALKERRQRQRNSF